MKIILLQDVVKVGKKYEVKNVADGYALNLLIPKKLAKVATDKEIKDLEIIKKQYEEKQKAREEVLIRNIEALSNSSINIRAKANKEGKLFSSIGKEDIILAIKDQKALNIDPENIVLDKPIKEANEQSIEIKADGKSAVIKINIVPNNE